MNIGYLYRLTSLLTNGPVTVSAVVTDKDGNTRTLTTTIIVEATQPFNHVKAWVDSVKGNDETGAVGNQYTPYKTISKAVSAAQVTNGGVSDGNIIYLEEGVYSASGVSAKTSSEWLTITAASGTDKEKVIINEGKPSTTFLRVDGVTLKSQGDSQYVLNNSATNLWTNNCRRIGAGRYIANSNPVHHSEAEGNGAHYSTNDYTYDSDYAYRRALLVRGATIKQVGNDVFENTRFVVNARLDDVDPGTTMWHADCYQVFSTGPNSLPANNRIIYNYYATNAHIEGVFMRSDYGQATDNAFVNCFIEMREPAKESEEGLVLTAFQVNHSWDHLIMWHCAFPYSNSDSYATATNWSMIGNVFWEFRGDASDPKFPNQAWAINGNAGNNEVLYNHYMYVKGVTGSGTPTSVDISKGKTCPTPTSGMPDSHATGSATYGDEVLDMTNTASNDYGKPLDGSILIDRIPFPTVPADIFGNLRDQKPDVGPIEITSGIPLIEAPGAPENLNVGQ